MNDYIGVGGFIALVVLVAIFLICREIFCWYWKINLRVALLTEIRDSLKGQSPTSDPSIEAALPVQKFGPSGERI
jgi:hypothetical protein